MKMAEQFEESQVLAELLEKSTQFRQYYEARRTKISQPIAWIQDNSLPVGVNAQALSDRSQQLHVISLRHIPAHAEDDAMIAEELEHCAYDEEGFPGTAPTQPQFQNLEAVLNSMLGDPIAHWRLIEFGFDFRENYQRESTESRRQLENAKEPTNRADIVLWMANYAADVIEFRGLGKGAGEFQLWFDAKFPWIAEKAKKFLAMIDRIGYDTPQKQKKLLLELSRRYNLRPFINIIAK